MWRNTIARVERSDGSFCFGSSVPPDVTVHSTNIVFVIKEELLFYKKSVLEVFILLFIISWYFFITINSLKHSDL